VGTVDRSNIAHILPNSSVDPSWNPNANGTVTTLALSGNIVYVAGSFTNIGGQARNKIAAIDATTGLATSWNPGQGSGGFDYVLSLAVSGSTVYTGGYFTSVGGQPRNNIAAIDANTGQPTSWNPNADSFVCSLLVSGSTVFACGLFTSIGGQARNKIAAIDATTGQATPWNPNANDRVQTLALSGSTIYAGGQFTNIGGQPRNHIAAIDITTGLATLWNPNADGYVSALAICGSTVYAGGSFDKVGNILVPHLAAIDTSGMPTNLSPCANCGASTLAVSGSTLYAGGVSSVGGVPRGNIAAIDATTGQATAWDPRANSIVYALAFSGSRVYAGGRFTNIGGETRNRLAALEATGQGTATPWNPNANSVVNTLAVRGTGGMADPIIVYAGGQFTNIGGEARSRIAAIGTFQSDHATSWNPNANDIVNTITVNGSNVYVGGSFTNIGGVARNKIAAIDTTTGQATSWNPSANNTVNTMAVSGSNIYAGGEFTSIGGQTRSYIAAIDAVTGLATSWNANADNSVYSLAVSGSTVYAGGRFTNIGGETRNRLAALESDTGAATSWDPNVCSNSDYVYALAVSGDLYIGGMFQNISYFASFPGYATVIPSVEVPTKFGPGEAKACSVYVQNETEDTLQCAGTNPTNPVKLVSYVTDANGGNKQPETRVDLPRDVKTREIISLSAPVQAPTTPGNWRINFDLVKEGAGGYYFSERGYNLAKVDIVIGSPPDDPERTASSQCGKIPWMSYAGMGGMDVNLFNGTTTTAVTDLTVPGRGVPFSMSRTYSSTNVNRNPDSPAPLFGPNWFSNLDVKVKDYGNGYIAYYDAQGRSCLLVESNTPNTFICPEGEYFKAEKNPNYANSGDSNDSKNWKYKVTGTSGAAEHFDENGRLLYIADVSKNSSGTGNYKNKTRVEYASGRPSKVIDASGRDFLTSYDSQGRILTVVEDAGHAGTGCQPVPGWANQDGRSARTVTYEYNGPEGRLSKVTLSPGNHWNSYTYNPDTGKNNLITQTEKYVETGKTEKTHFGYTNGKLTSYTDPRVDLDPNPPDKYTSTVTYNSGNTVVSSPTVSNYMGAANVKFSTKYIFDGLGHTTSKIVGVNPDGTGTLEQTDQTWNAIHQVMSVTNALGSTNYLYDGKGNATRVSDDLEGTDKAVSTADYTASQDCSENPKQVTSPDGETVNMEYNTGQSYFKTVDKAGAQSVVLRDSATENDKSSVTLPSPYVNLIQNASFENYGGSSGVADSWTPGGSLQTAGATSYQVYEPATPDAAAAGRKVQRIAVQGNSGSGDVAVRKKVAAEHDTDYTLSLSYRNSTSANQVNSVIFRQIDSGNSVISEKSLVLNRSSAWNRASLTFKTASNAAFIEVQLDTRVTQVNQNLWVDYDAVQLYKGTRDTAFNYVENGAFEQSNGANPPDPTGWSIVGLPFGHQVGFKSVSPGQSLRLMSIEYASQTVNVKRNTRYLVSGYMYVTGGSETKGAQFSCGSDKLYYNSGKGYVEQDTENISNTGKWVRLSKVVSSGDSDTLTILLDARNLTGGGTSCYAYYDDVSLTELPDDVQKSYDSTDNTQNYVTQVKSPTDPNSYSTSYAKYDPVGNLTEARDARSANATDNTYCFRYTYNELDAITSVVSPLVRNALSKPIQQYSASYNYNSAGRMTNYSDNNVKATSFAYNMLGKVTGKTDPDLRTLQVEYNEAGGVKKVVYPNGWETYYSYRMDGRVDMIAFKSPQGQVTNSGLQYDNAGNPFLVYDQTGYLYFTYDKASRLKTLYDPLAGGFTSTYTYSKAGKLTAEQYSKSGWGPNVSVSYGYRDTGEPYWLGLPGNRSINYVYDDRGRLSTRYIVPDASSSNLNNSSSFSYDAAGRLSLISHNFQGQACQVKYEYDQVGNITKMTQDSREDTYTYDELCRLTSWVEKDSVQKINDEKYYYDGNGNITRVVSNGTAKNYTCGNANQITNRGFTYDQNGNMTSDGKWTYEYDRGSRLVSATSSAANLKLVFGYGPGGTRASKTAFERDAQGQYTVQKYAVYYHYDSGGNITCETDASGNIIRSYAYDLSGHPVAFTQDLGSGQKTFYLHTNSRGDVIYITDDTGAWVKKYSYDPWGKIQSETPSSSQYASLKCPFTYAGYYYDSETGLYYLRARYYSPTLRRFLTKDSEAGSRRNPLTLNPYQYCGGNPVIFVDPSGQWFGLENLGAYFSQGGRQMATFAQGMNAFASMNYSYGVVAACSRASRTLSAAASASARPLSFYRRIVGPPGKDWTFDTNPRNYAAINANERARGLYVNDWDLGTNKNHPVSTTVALHAWRGSMYAASDSLEKTGQAIELIGAITAQPEVLLFGGFVEWSGKAFHMMLDSLDDDLDEW